MTSNQPVPSNRTLQWQQFASHARAGELYVDDEVAAREALAACDKRISDLSAMLATADIVKRVSGFGDFDMGHALEGAYRKQATGEPNSIDAVIRDHIETVKNMREVMAESIKRITGQDAENAARIAKSAESVGR